MDCLIVGAGFAGAVYLSQRHRLGEARERTRRVLAEGRTTWEQLWRRWLDGGLARTARDLEIDLLIENLALSLVEREQP